MVFDTTEPQSGPRTFTSGIPGFFGSAISAVPETFGLPPLAGVEAFRQENPVAGIGSQFIGAPAAPLAFLRAAGLLRLGVPLAARATASVGTFAGESAAIGRLANAFIPTERLERISSPVVREVLRDTSALVPFELGRIGAATFFQTDPLGLVDNGEDKTFVEAFLDSAATSAIDLTVGAAAGGVLGLGASRLAARSRGKSSAVALLEQRIPGLATAQSATLKSRILDEHLAGLQSVKQQADPSSPEFLEIESQENLAKDAVASLEDAVLRENPIDGRRITAFGNELLGTLDAGKHVRRLPDQPLADDVEVNATDLVEGLFTGKSSGVSTRKLVRDSKIGFDKVGEAEAFQARFSLPDDFLRKVQFPRALTGRSDQLFSRLKDGLGDPVEIDNSLAGVTVRTFLQQETDEGAFVIAKLREIAGEGEAEALLFKTDDPLSFTPDTLAGLFEASPSRAASLEEPFISSPDVAALRKTLEELLPDHARVLHPVNRVVEIANAYDVNLLKSPEALAPPGPKTPEVRSARAFLRRQGIQETAESLTAATQIMRGVFSPLGVQFSQQPLARQLVAVVQGLLRDANMLAETTVFGKATAGTVQEQIRQSSLGGFATAFKSQADFLEGGIIKAYRGLDAPAQNDVYRAISRGLTPEAMAAQEGVSEEAAGVFQLIANGIDDSVASVFASSFAAGARGLKVAIVRDQVLEMMSHRGNHLVRIFNDEDQVLGFASGVNPQEAGEIADEIIERGKGAFKREDEVLTVDRRIDIAVAKEVGDGSEPAPINLDEQLGEFATEVRFRAGTRKDFVEVRQNIIDERLEKSSVTQDVGTAANTVGVNLSDWVKPSDVAERMFVFTRANYTRSAMMTFESVMGPKLMELQRTNHEVWEQLRRRIGLMLGEQGEITKALNKASDKFVGALGFPVKNSASAITQKMNEFLFHNHLGFANLAHPIINMTTMFQTVLPELSYIQTAPDLAMTQHYLPTAIMNSAGEMVSTGWNISPVRLMMNSLKRMAKPDEELRASIARAINERELDPKLVEEFIGEGSGFSRGIKAAFKEEGFTGALRRVSGTLPARSEQFARLHAFVTGHMAAKEIIEAVGKSLPQGSRRQMDPEVVFEFARKFTHRTMVQYGTGDRALLMQGPIGGLWGLFKNWTWNYLSLMTNYSDLALRRGVIGLQPGAFKPLLYASAGPTLFGGLAASPLFSAGNEVQKLFTDESFVEGLYSSMDQENADFVFMGLPTLVGMSLTSSAQAPGADFARDAASLLSTVHADHVKFATRAFGAAGDAMQAGQNPFEDVRTQQLAIRAFAPRTVYKSFQVMEDDQIRSLDSGYPLVDNQSLRNRLQFVLGLTPPEATVAFEAADVMFREQNKRRSLIRALGRQLSEAQLNRDTQNMSQIMRIAIASGIDFTSVLRSAQARIDKANKDIFGRSFEATESNRFRSLVTGDRNDVVDEILNTF